MYRIYRGLTWLVAPVMPVLLRRRLVRGKEDAAHLGERMGQASQPRLSGKLVWIHAASVGESNSVLPLMEKMLEEYQSLNILLTTVTVTSADMMRRRLPPRAVHQFAPVDIPAAVDGFLSHWRPDIALWVDSELWPNTIIRTKKQGACMGLINARMSEQSFHSWRFARPLAHHMLSCFNFCFAQSAQDGTRLNALGIPSITGICNLKYDAPLLPFDEKELEKLKVQTVGRAMWVAASTHPGEEKMIAQVHAALKMRLPHLLTLIVPRHARRGNEIMAELEELAIAQRSRGDAINAATDIYLADTMGELGLFYRLAPIAFIGGTLVPHGGQNPLEAARIGCAVLAGPHAHNFADVVSAMEADGAILRVASPQALEQGLDRLMFEKAECQKLAQAALSHVQARGGAVDSIMKLLQQVLS